MDPFIPPSSSPASPRVFTGSLVEPPPRRTPEEIAVASSGSASAAATAAAMPAQPPQSPSLTGSLSPPPPSSLAASGEAAAVATATAEPPAQKRESRGVWAAMGTLNPFRHRRRERAQQRASQQQMQEEAKHHHGGASVWTVPELLEKTGVEDLDELLRLSRAELQEQFGWLDPISWRRLQDALDEARQQPVWLSQEVQQLRLAVVVSVGVLTGWGIGFYQHSILWALLAAYIVGRLWRTMAEKFLYRSSAHARRRAARSRATRYGETAEWLNNVALEFWRMGGKEMLESMIRESLNDVLSWYKLPGMESLEITVIDLGQEGLRVEEVKAYGTDHTGEHKIDVSSMFMERRSKISFKVKLPGGLSSVFTLTKLQVHADLRFYLTFNPKLDWPHIEQASVSLRSEPHIDFGLAPIGTFDVLKLFPAVDSWINGLLVDCLCELLQEPDRFQMYNADTNVQVEGASGLMTAVVLITVHRGEHLRPKSKKRRHTDPQFSVAMEVAGQTVETPAALGENPQWNMQFAFPILNVQTDRATIDVFDRRLGLKPGGIGRKRLYLREVFAAETRAVQIEIDMYDSIGAIFLELSVVQLAKLPSYYLPPYNYEVLERQKQKLKSARDLARDTSEAQEAADLMDYLSPMLNLYYENQTHADGPETANDTDTQDAQRLQALQNAPLTSKTGLLFVRIHEAADLAAHDRDGKSDPFCVTYFNGEKVFQTAYVPKNLNPKWDTIIDDPQWLTAKAQRKERCWKEFMIEDVTRSWIEFRLYDQDGISSEYMGSARLKLGPLADDARHVIKRQWIYLDRSKKTTRPPDSLVLPDEDMGIGRICVSVVFRPIEVNDTTFAYESLPGRQALTADGTKRPRNKTVRNEARRLAAGSARLDPNGGPVRAPIFYPKGGRLDVHIQQARQLPAKDHRLLGANSSDPYVIVKLGEHEVYRTKVVYKTLSPIWKDEQFSVTVMNAQEEKLTIVCLDRDLVGADDFLGVVTMDVSEALSGAPKWYDFTEGSGQIKLAITFTSSAKLQATATEAEVQAKEQVTEHNAVMGLVNGFDAVGLDGDVVSLGSDDDEPMQDALTDTSMMTTFTSTPAPLSGHRQSLQIKRGRGVYRFARLRHGVQQFRMRLTFVKGINLNGHFAKARLSAYPVRQLERIASVPQRRISDDGLVEWGHSIEIDGVELDDPFLVSVASRSRRLQSTHTLGGASLLLKDHFSIPTDRPTEASYEQRVTLTLEGQRAALDPSIPMSVVLDVVLRPIVEYAVASAPPSP